MERDNSGGIGESPSEAEEGAEAKVRRRGESRVSTASSRRKATELRERTWHEVGNSPAEGYPPHERGEPPALARVCKNAEARI